MLSFDSVKRYLLINSSNSGSFALMYSLDKEMLTFCSMKIISILDLGVLKTFQIFVILIANFCVSFESSI